KPRAPGRASHRRAPDPPQPARLRTAIAGPSRDRLREQRCGAHAPRPQRGRECALSFDALDKDLDLAAAGEADFPGLVVGDAEIEQPRLAVTDRFERLLDNRTLYAAARYRADHGARIVDRELGSNRPRRGTPRCDDSGQRHARPRLAPP